MKGTYIVITLFYGRASGMLSARHLANLIDRGRLRLQVDRIGASLQQQNGAAVFGWSGV